MRLILFLLFVALPLLELALLIKLGQVAGFWATLGLIVGTALLGSILLNRQGLGVMRRAAEALEHGKPPVAAVVDGVFLFIAGLLLVTPGLVSDTIGLLLFIPPLRRSIANAIFRLMLKSGDVHVATMRTTRRSTSGEQRPGGSRAGGVIIETEFERLDEHTIDPRRPDQSPPRNKGH